MNSQLLVECMVVGVQVSFLTFIIRRTMEYFELNRDINKYLILFFVGASVHYISEIVGINKEYCKNGIACKKLKEK